MKHYIFMCYISRWKKKLSLWKHTYSNTCIQKISPIKKLIFFIFLLIHRLWDIRTASPTQIVGTGRGGSNEYPQSMFLSRNNVYPCKPQFFYIKVGFMEIKIILACFRDAKILVKEEIQNIACECQPITFFVYWHYNDVKCILPWRNIHAPLLAVPDLMLSKL